MIKILPATAMLLVAACGSKETAADAGASAPAAPAAAIEAPIAAQETVAAPETVASPEAGVKAAMTDAAPSTESAAPPLWTVDHEKSRIEFTGSQTGKDFTGSFSAFDISIAFDPGNLGASHIKATIETASAATGDKQRDDALPSSDWFASSSFPAAVFESSDIRAAGRGYEARGKLTLRGVSKDITLPFTLEIAGDRAVADGAVTLLRTDFGVGQGEFATGEWVGLDVKVSLHIEAKR